MVTIIVFISFVVSSCGEDTGSQMNQDSQLEESTDASLQKETESELAEALVQAKAAAEEATALELAETEAEAIESAQAEEEAVLQAQEEGIHSYVYYVSDCTWEEAFQSAIAKGGYLVHINTYEEYAYILDEIESLGYRSIQFRIGGRRDEGSTGYYWVDNMNDLYGEQLNTSLYWAQEEWYPNEPSFKDGEIEEDCLDIYYNNTLERWVWNDVPNDIIEYVPEYAGRLGYIVEFEN